METVATNMVIFVELIRNCIEESMFGHGAMESIVEHNHLRCGGHKCIYGPDTTQMTRVVHGCEVAKVFYSLFYLWCNDAAVVKLIAALNDAMAHSINLAEVFDGTNFLVEKGLENEVHTLLMVGHVVHNHLFLAVWER